MGDFANAGNLHIAYRDSVDKNIESVTVGSFGYLRALALGSAKVGEGSLLYAGEINTYDGPWTYPDRRAQVSQVSCATARAPRRMDCRSPARAYTNNWNTADQIPLRAVTTGQIGLFGQIDPTDGGDTSRFSLSGQDGPNRMMAAHGKPMRMWSNTP